MFNPKINNIRNQKTTLGNKGHWVIFNLHAPQPKARFQLQDRHATKLPCYYQTHRENISHYWNPCRRKSMLRKESNLLLSYLWPPFTYSAHSNKVELEATPCTASLFIYVCVCLYIYVHVCMGNISNKRNFILR